MAQLSTAQKLTSFFGVAVQILGVLFLARLTIDVGTRLIYPFIPQFSAGLGLSIVGFSWLLFIRSLAGVAGPLFGVAADRYGRRKLMATGLWCQSIGVLGLALTWQWWAVLPMLFYGVSLAAFIPAQQAYISDQVAYHRRGRALATIEFSWATSGIVALPIVGWMIDTFNWQLPLIVLGLFSLIFAGIVWFLLPVVEHHTQTDLSISKFWQVFVRPNVLATIFVGLLMFVGVGIFSTVWSIWLTADFSLTAVTLGFIATAIGIAELSGSGGSALFIDQIGKKRGSFLGLIGSGLAFLMLPVGQASLPLAIGGLVLIGLVIEFTVVSLIPLYSEQVPEARATVFSLVGFGVSIGVAVSAPLTAILWANYGLWAVCWLGAVTLFLAAGLVARFLTENQEQSQFS